tara:strand:+ start:20 stop:1057 length:1038 start_codon:yes stop_codon:yes gene_type:complete
VDHRSGADHINGRNFTLHNDRHFFEKEKKGLQYFDIAVMPKKQKRELYWNLLNTLAFAFAKPTELSVKQCDLLLNTFNAIERSLDPTLAFLHNGYVDQAREFLFERRMISPFMSVKTCNSKLLTRDRFFWELTEHPSIIDRAYLITLKDYIDLLFHGYQQLRDFEFEESKNYMYWDHRFNTLSKLVHAVRLTPEYAAGDSSTLKLVEEARDEILNGWQDIPKLFQQTMLTRFTEFRGRDPEERAEGFNWMLKKSKETSINANIILLMELTRDLELGDFTGGDAYRRLERLTRDQQLGLLAASQSKVDGKLRSRLIYHLAKTKAMTRVEVAFYRTNRQKFKKIDDD